MTLYRGPGGTGSATSDADTTLYQDFLNQTIAARDAALAAETAAELAETNAETAETNAETAEANAETAATNAASSASAAATSASNASSSASSAATSASAASTSATAAASSASSASSSASAASTSATSASTSATNAATSETNAANSATSASNSASTATTQATNAASSASAAATSASSAATSATNASNSASSAATSATNAASSATAAAASATAAAASAASIDPDTLVKLTGDQTIGGTKTFTSTISGSITGNAGTVTNGVYTTGDQTIAGTKTFSSNPVLSAGTANGVAYLNGSKVLTTGSTLTFDGENLTFNGTSAPRLLVNMNGAQSTRFAIQNSATNGNTRLFLYPNGTGNIAAVNGRNSTDTANYSGFDLAVIGTSDVRLTSGAEGTGAVLPISFYLGASEQMRLTSTGLGIGASTLNGRLTLKLPSSVSEQVMLSVQNASATDTLGRLTYDQTADTLRLANMSAFSGASLRFGNNGLDQLTLSLAGNLGLGVTPSAWSTSGNMQLPTLTFAGQDFSIGANYYQSGGSRYITNAPSSRISFFNGTFQFIQAPSGTAGTVMSSTQAMTLDASGNLGVGTTSPAVRTEVSGTEASVSLRVSTANSGVSSSNFSQIQLADNGAVRSYWRNVRDGAGQTQFAYNSFLAFLSDANGTPTERARIDSGGNFRVRNPTGGNTSNGFLVEEDGSNVTRVSIGGANSSGATGLSIYSTTANAFRFFVSYSGQINATSTSITAISDQSLKENIRDLETGLSEVMALKPRRFDWKEETQLEQKNVAGFIAQEVEQVLPELVYDYQYSADTTKKSLKMGDILPTLVKAIQELKADLDATKAELAALKGQP